MLSKKAKYGLTALIHLARSQNKGPVLISVLAKEGRIPKKFLELILLELKNEGVLQSKKGKGGGYYLARPAELIRIGHIIRVLDGPLAPIGCVSETAYEKCVECSDEKTCPIRVVMKQVRDAIANILDSTTLSELSKSTKLKKHMLI
ncbi:Rrf2 family transcriptional regulator [bacterium]|nr:Rrf2 family transcriptional regulator [bacterium]